MLIAAVIEEGPGIGIISILFKIHSFTKSFLGSESKGVPASDTSDKILPSFKYRIILGIFFSH